MTWLRIIALTCLLLFPSKTSHKHVKPDMKQAQCLATLLFHEARGEGITGRLGVAAVALNRASRAIPKYGSLDICAIMKEDRQFSWYRKYPRVFTIEELGDMLYEAHLILEQYRDGTFIDVTGNATHFATKGVHNYWTRRFKHTVTIGSHKFYREINKEKK